MPSSPIALSSSSTAISVVGVGKYRQNAIDVSHLFNNTPFRFAAMLDTASPKPYNYTPDSLRLVLRSLHPRPRCFLAGEAIEENENEGAREVWDDFVEEKGVEGTFCINVSTYACQVGVFQSPLRFLVGLTCEQLRELEGRRWRKRRLSPKEQLTAETMMGMMMGYCFPEVEKRG